MVIGVIPTNAFSLRMHLKIPWERDLCHFKDKLLRTLIIAVLAQNCNNSPVELDNLLEKNFYKAETLPNDSIWCKDHVKKIANDFQ